MKKCDVFIIGAGPAGTSAAIYASRAGLDTVINESGLVGGQTAQSFEIKNYAGFEEISGAELSEKMFKQLKSNDITLEEFDTITGIDFTTGVKKITTENNSYTAKAVIIATGAAPRKLPIPQEAQYSGKGIHYCAICDGGAYKNKIAAVAGGGNGAIEEALYLSGIAERVEVFCRSNEFRGERRLAERILLVPNINVHFNENIISASGENILEYVETENTADKSRKKHRIDGLFINIGRRPQTSLFQGRIDIDEKGYIITDEKLMTNIKGVFAAGDVRQKKWRQIATAVSDGAAAALEAESYIKGAD